jgi:hypothetical protein
VEVVPLLGVPLVATPLLGVPLLVVPLLVVPLEPLPLAVPLLGGEPQGPHTPLVEPRGTEHDVPGQQSADVVQAPHALTHVAVKQMKGGDAPATGLGTQGTAPQQSALEAHAPPDFTQVAGEQRGTPTLSW